MNALLKIFLYLLLLLTVCRLSDHLYTIAETQVRGWYLTRPSFSVMGMSEGMSEAEELDQ
jgi:hypothetical protein